MEQTKKTILIVEDDPAEQKALTDKLTREGYRILSARDGQEGLSIAQLSHPDLILLDIIMPKMDGLTMMKKLRAEKSEGQHVPIILLTNLNPDEETINKSISEAEPAYYLVKANWSLDDVAEKVAERLNRI